MPLIPNSSFISPKWLPNGHFQSIYPSIFRKIQEIPYQRERISTPDDDFLDLDWLKHTRPNKILVIVSHGLEGDSERQYAKGMASAAFSIGYDALAWNFRSCSGETNKQLRFYHSGATDDLQTVVNHGVNLGYQSIFLIGFSLGGNLTLKYLGENNVSKHVKKAITFSVPLHLSSGSKHLEKWQNYFYTKRFNLSLFKKIRAKAELYPTEINLNLIDKITTLRDFDNCYTSKLHGFVDAEDYYSKNSSINFLDNINIPTLIVNAANDPFLSKECFPTEKIGKLKNVYFEMPKNGGHCGFYPVDYKKINWAEKRALEFIKENL